MTMDASPLPWKLVPNGDSDILIDADGRAIGEMRAGDAVFVISVLEAWQAEKAGPAKLHRGKTSGNVIFLKRRKSA